jgi:hypothetical protein
MNTVIRMSIQRMVCTGCGAEANASCNCGVSYMAKSARAAEAIKANPRMSNRAIAEETGISEPTVRRARASYDAPERTGQDGKSYSIRQRVSDDPDEAAAAATGRRRVFLRCAEDAVRKAEQGAGLKDAKEPEIDDEILMALEKVIKAWTCLRDEILNRKGE